MLKLVLLALTDKADGTSALRLAAAVAARHKSGFMVQYVSAPHEREQSCVLQLSDERELSARRVEIEAFCRANMPEGLTADVMLGSGFVHIEVLKTVRLMEPDLVVIGDQGDAEHCRRELSASTMDTALLIAREAACPVLVAFPETLRALNQPLSEMFQRIVAATDLLGGAEDVLTMAERVREADAGTLFAFHALPLVHTELGGAAQGQAQDRALDQALDQAKSRLAYFGRKLVLPSATQSAVREGDPSVEILKFSRENEADLIVLAPDCYTGAPGSPKMKSRVSSQVLAGARCPVMLVGPDALAGRFQKQRQTTRKA